ncbi:MAG TPA: hypothetical protein VLG46_12165 [Anaerolineae bacterium]|nr:hypothetical protein [Anaerolineae bacterium]
MTAAAPVGIVYAAEVLQLIRCFGIDEAHYASAVVLMLIYASGLALLPLLPIRTIG